MTARPRKKAGPAADPKPAPRRPSARERALASDAPKLAAGKPTKAGPAKSAKVEKKSAPRTFDMLADVNAIIAPSKAFPDGKGELPRTVIAAAFAEHFGRKSTTIYPIRLVRLTEPERDALIAVLLDVKAGKITAPVRGAARVPGPSKAVLAERLAKVEHLLNEAHGAKTIAAMRQHVVSALDVVTGQAAS